MGWLSAVVVVLVGIALAGLFVLLQSDAGRQHLAGWLSPLLSAATGYEVEIEGIGPGLPARIGIDKLTLADTEGVWLTVEALAVSWRPTGLLRGRVAVDAVGADRFELARTPVGAEPEPEPEGGKFSIPQLSIGLSIDRLTIGVLVLGETVLGDTARLRADGRLAAPSGGVISTGLTIDRIDGRQGRVALDAKLDPTTRRLHLDASVNEAEHGLIAGLLDLAPYSPVSLRLVGDGPLDDWRGTIQADAAGLASLAGNLRAAATATGNRLGFDGRAEWHGAMPPVLRPAIKEGVHIAVSTELATNGSIVVDALRLEAGDLIVDATGRLDPETSVIAAQAHVSIGPAALAPESLAGYRMKGIGAEAVVSGRFDAIEIAAAGTISGLAGPLIKSADLAWQASLAPDISGEKAVRLTVDGMAVTPIDPRLSALVGPAPTALMEGRLSASGDALDLQAARVTTASAAMSASGRLALDEAPSDLRIEAALADVAALEPLTGLAGAGEVRVVAQVQGPLATGAAVARIDGAAKNLRTGLAVADAALGAAPVLSCSLSVDPASGLTVSELRLDGTNVGITGEAQTDAAYKTFSASGRASVADLAALARAAGTEATGRLQLQATASGALADPDARLRISLRDASIAGFPVNEGEIMASATRLASRPTGDARASLQMADGPVEAATRFGIEDGELLLTGLSATGFGVRANGDLGMQMPSGLWRGQVHATLPASGRVSVGGSHLSGRADARIRLTPVAGRQSVDAWLQGGSLVLGAAAAESVGIGAIEATARVDDAFAAARMDATVHAIGVRAGGEGPIVLDARATGHSGAVDVRLNLDGPADRLDQLATTLQIGFSGGGTTVTVTALQGIAGGYPLALSTPLRVIAGSGRLQIDDLDLTVGEGRLAGRLDLSPGNTSGVLRLEAVPVRILRGWLPSAPVAGTLSGNGELTTRGGVIRGASTVSGVGLSFAAGKGIASPAIAADAQAFLGEGGIDLKANAGDAGATAVAATLTLPLRPVPGAFDLRMSAEAPLAGEVRVRGDLARIAEALGLPDQRLAGRLAGNVRLGGSLSRPEATGALTIEEGVYENFVTGTLITGITGRVDFSEGRAARIALSGTPAGGGSIAADGQISLAGDGAPDVELRIGARDARLVARDDVTATVGGRLTFHAGPRGNQLAGNLMVTPVEIRLRDRLPQSVVVLPVIEINRPGGEAAPPPAPSGPNFVAALDVGVDIPRRVFARGRGLESEWAGALHVGGTTATPTLAGEVHLVRGDFTFASKRLRLQKGIVSFTGGPVIDPLLDVAAEYQTSQMMAVIGVTGPVSDPALVVSSQPPLPESEVLAQLMFGKGTARLSPVEAVQLAAALDSLNRGDTWTADAFGSMRQFLGLDVLNVDPGAGADRGPSVEVGRYLGDHVFIGARRGLADQTSGGRVEVEILPGISLQSDFLQDVQGTSGSIGLRFKRDY